MRYLIRLTVLLTSLLSISACGSSQSETDLIAIMESYEAAWNAKDLDGLTIRSETENKDVKTSTELRSIVLKTPAASLFEIPAGYSEAKGYMDLMANGTQRE